MWIRKKNVFFLSFSIFFFEIAITAATESFMSWNMPCHRHHRERVTLKFSVLSMGYFSGREELVIAYFSTSHRLIVIILPLITVFLFFPLVRIERLLAYKYTSNPGEIIQIEQLEFSQPPRHFWGTTSVQSSETWKKKNPEYQVHILSAIELSLPPLSVSLSQQPTSLNWKTPTVCQEFTLKYVADHTSSLNCVSEPTDDSESSFSSG